MRPYFVGLAAQGLTLVASLIPVLLVLEEELIWLVTGSALAAVLVHPATLAIQSTFPSIRRDQDARIAVASSLLSLCVVTFIFVGACCAIAFYFEQVPMLFGLATGALLLCQGLYFVVMAIITRHGNLGILYRTRLIYGIASVIFTSIAATVFRSNQSLIIAAASAFAVTAAFGAPSLLKASNVRVVLKGVTSTGILIFIRKSRSATGAFLLSGLSGQSTALITPLLGELSAAWAAATRLANGFQTTGGQLIAPRFDIDMARSLRSGDYAGALVSYKKATSVGIILGFVSVFAILIFLLFAGDYWPEDNGEAAILAFSIAVGWGSTISVTVGAKFLTLAGRPTSRFILEFIRAVFYVLCIMFFSGVTLLLATAIVSGVSMFALILLGLAHKQLE